MALYNRGTMNDTNITDNEEDTAVQPSGIVLRLVIIVIYLVSFTLVPLFFSFIIILLYLAAWSRELCGTSLESEQAHYRTIGDETSISTTQGTQYGRGQ